jgi:hypothetical protein
MRPAGTLVMALSDDHALVVDDDRTHDRIGRRLSEPSLGETQRPLHVVVI